MNKFFETTQLRVVESQFGGSEHQGLWNDLEKLEKLLKLNPIGELKVYTVQHVDQVQVSGVNAWQPYLMGILQQAGFEYGYGLRTEPEPDGRLVFYQVHPLKKLIDRVTELLETERRYLELVGYLNSGNSPCLTPKPESGSTKR